jgi:hypothetical protein
MIEEVGEIAKNYLDTYRIGGSGSNQFIDKLAGVVQVITKEEKYDTKTITKSFPVACNVDFAECNNPSVLKDLVPDSRLGCIVYFEGLSMSFVGQRGRKMAWRGQYRIVGWVNKKKLGKANLCSVSSQIITAIIAAFPQFPENAGIYQQLMVKVLGQEPKTSNPFSKFSYDEKINQYLMHPFDFFSLMTEVTFETDLSCIPVFEKETENIC